MKLLLYECAALISTIYARSALTSDERDTLLDSIKTDPERKKAKAILAQKLIDDPDSPDIRSLYEKLKE